MNRQERMYQVINGLGIKPTEMANLPTLKMPHRDNIKELKDKVESLMIHDKENAKTYVDNRDYQKDYRFYTFEDVLVLLLPEQTKRFDSVYL